MWRAARRRPFASRGTPTGPALAVRRCAALNQISEPLQALRASPALNSTALVTARLAEARTPNACKPPRFTFVPAAAGAQDAWLDIYGGPDQMIRGGALPRTMAGTKRINYVNRVRMADVASWLLRSFVADDWVVLKMDVEGAEHTIVPKMLALNATGVVDVLLWECRA